MSRHFGQIAYPIYVVFKISTSIILIILWYMISPFLYSVGDSYWSKSEFNDNKVSLPYQFLYHINDF